MLSFPLTWNARATEPSEVASGRWYPNTRAEEQATRALLEAVGYVGGDQPNDAQSGVTIWDRARAEPGPRLYSSGHAPEAALIALDGTVLHRWGRAFEEAFPGIRSDDARATGAWRGVALRPSDGHLLAVYDGLGVVHLDARSRVVWATANRAHHEARWRSDGGVLTLTREVRPGEGPMGKPLLEDFVSVLDANGHEVRRVSVLRALVASEWRPLLEQADPDSGDPLHTNAIFRLDGLADPTGRDGAGRVLLSLRNLDALVVLDLADEALVWAQTGNWSRQHDAHLAGGSVWLFDNQGGPGQTSRVQALAPWTLTPRWSWGGTPEQPLSSEVLGSVQLLPHGNVLLAESTRGRAIEVTPEGTIVWEFHNPHVTGPGDAYVAAIFELVRPPAGPLPWLVKPGG